MRNDLDCLNNLACKEEEIILKKTYVGVEIQYELIGNFENVISYRGYDVVNAITENTRIYSDRIICLAYNINNLNVNGYPDTMKMKIIRLIGIDFK